MNDTENQYFKMRPLAKVLGVSYCMVRAMKMAGFPFPGGRATPADARKWLRKNPDFKISNYTDSKRRPKPAAPSAPVDCGNPLCPVHHDGPAPYCELGAPMDSKA